MTAYFIVSTGRAGSKMISRVLAEHPQVCALHEPPPHLNTEGLLAWSNSRRTKRIRTRIQVKRKRLIREIQDNNLTYIESSHYLSHLILEIDEIFDAKFIYLYRNGKNFVRSALQQGWYNTPPPSEYLKMWIRRTLTIDIGSSYLDHLLNPPRHLRTRTEKLMWLWVEINTSIQEQLNEIPNERKMSIRLEDFDVDTIHRLHQFINLSIDSECVSRMLQTALMKPNQSARLKVSRDAPTIDENLKRFDEIAGDLMRTLGYES